MSLSKYAGFTVLVILGHPVNFINMNSNKVECYVKQQLNTEQRRYDPYYSFQHVPHSTRCGVSKVGCSSVVSVSLIDSGKRTGKQLQLTNCAIVEDPHLTTARL